MGYEIKHRDKAICPWEIWQKNTEQGDIVVAMFRYKSDAETYLDNIYGY